MTEELLKRHSAELVEHMAAYLEAVENLKADEAKIIAMNQLPSGETKIGLDAALNNYRTIWLNAWGIHGSRNMRFVQRHATEILNQEGQTILK